jgi:hypothetical protein
MRTVIRRQSWLALKIALFASLITMCGLRRTAAARDSSPPTAAPGAPQGAVSPPTVTENLKAPDGQAVLMRALGKGVQIYQCEAAAADPNKFEWTFSAPEADLMNDAGEKIGKHYAGPIWEALDGSKVVGEVQQRADAPKSGAVPWLLLKAKSNAGAGTFQSVTYIQRVDTEGGKAPTEGCDKNHLNAVVRVNYQADYYFYVPAR